MRVGLVSPYDLGKPGGVQAQVLGLAEQLRRRGDEALVIGPGLPAGVDGVDLGRSAGVPGNRSVVPVTVNPRVGRKIKEAGTAVDVLHVHEPLMPFASLAALRAGPPVVATFHADPGVMGRRLYTITASQLSRVLGSRVRQVTAVSATAASPLPSYLEVTIVPNGLDVEAMRAEVPRVPGRVTFLGRDEPRKGLDVLLEAWPQVTEQVPDADLLVVGADRGIEGITWMGRIDDREKAEVLSATTLYVAPNLGGESFGIVLVEAMAAGALVVASNLKAFQEVGGDTAVYFPVGDSAAMAKTVTRLLLDPTRTQARGEAGRERAAIYDWSIVADAYRRVYEVALS
jgi:phosphatidylinositol alpha-mannosyltransferase